jgi:phosphotransferase system HPr (HPr) family protein
MDTSATKRVVVSRPEGLHARPCVAIASTIRRFNSYVEVASNGQKVDGRDVLQLLSMGVAQGREVVLTALGPDANEVLDALEKLFQNNFGLS